MRWSDADGSTAGVRHATAAVAALVIGAWANLGAAARAFAATPSPTTALGGDPRSSGQGPGLVGDPLLAITIVVAIGLVALGATLLYVRMTGGPRPG